jgi:hypothetical protein
MPSLTRTGLFLACVLATAVNLHVCAHADSKDEDQDLLKDEMPALWVKTFEARGWVGYKDNVLLGNQNLVASPFLAAGGDMTLLRLPLDGWESTIFTSADYIRYLSAPSIADQEANAIVEGQIKRELPDDWKVGIAGEFVYFKQVFDNSIISAQLVALPVDGYGLTLRPLATKSFGNGYHLDLDLPATRQMFDEFIDNYWEVGPRVAFGREFGRKSDLSVAYQFNDRIQDLREARNADGTLIIGRGLQFYQHELTASWRQFWGAESHWRTMTRLSLQRNEDNGGGYYNFWRPQIVAQLRYQTKKWDFRAETRLSYYAYDRQQIGDPTSPVRQKTYFRVNLRAERAISKSLRFFIQYEHEQAISNLDLDQYDVNTYSAGLDWEF